MLSRTRFAEWLRGRIEERRPTSIVRFGDGEKAFIEVDGKDPRSVEFAADKLAKQTGRMPSPEAVLEIQRSMLEAFDQSDVLGILFQGQRALSRGRLDGPGSKNDGLTSFYRRRRSLGKTRALLARRRLAHDLLDVLPDLLSGRLVSVISCRDLAPALGEWGVDDAAVYRIPSEHMTRELDGTYEAAMHDVPIWPDVHDRVRDEITVREPGEVFLIGAGIWGKDLCVRVRRRAGIALDMGSALDWIAGKVTRGPWRDVYFLQARGRSVAEIAAYLEDRHGKQADRDKIAEFIAQGPSYRADESSLLPWAKDAPGGSCE